MNAISYNKLMHGMKSSLKFNTKNEFHKESFFSNFPLLLKDCETCILQSFKLIKEVLVSGVSLQINELLDYLNNAVTVLQMLCSYITNVIQSVTLSCYTVKLFPIITGNILKAVFHHCKESESIYSNHLGEVQKQLKDLFRSCHELQLMYLMVLEKHYIFNLAEKDDQDVLIEALKVNLEIAEIVQTLDVKTTAELWKAYTTICEKYSSYLLSKTIHCTCAQVLCDMIENNLTTAFEINQQENIILRSLKISSFSIKILTRICTIFNDATNKNYESIVDLLLKIYLHDSTYLAATRNAARAHVVATNVCAPADLLVRQLLYDDNFVYYLLNYDVINIRTHDKFLGYILLILSIIKHIIRVNDPPHIKHELLKCIYNVLPVGHVCFNMGLKFKMESNVGQETTCGLMELVCTRAAALTATMTSDEFNALEVCMIQALLGVDCYVALFTINLWILLARMISRQLLLSQLLSLCRMYQTMEDHAMFRSSPQEKHLNYTISSLFKIMHDDDKRKVWKQFSLCDDRNLSLWRILKISNLPDEKKAVDIVVEKFMTAFQKTESQMFDIDKLRCIISVAATCSYIEHESVERAGAAAWGRGDARALLPALRALTAALHHALCDRPHRVTEILTVISSMVEAGDTETKLLLIDVSCQLANYEIYDENKTTAAQLVTNIFKLLLLDTCDTVKYRLCNILSRKHRYTDRIAKIITADVSLREKWNCFVNNGLPSAECTTELKEQLTATMDFRYRHKCVAIDTNVSEPIVKLNTMRNSNNFDFADVESLLETESDLEPKSKKIKLNTMETDAIISRLDTEVKMLLKIKENITSKQRAKLIVVSNKLQDVID